MREVGFYWVKLKYDYGTGPWDRWEVLHWEDHHWWASATQGAIPEDQILEVKGRLVSPEEKPKAASA